MSEAKKTPKAVNVKACNATAVKTCPANLALLFIGIAAIVVGAIIGFMNSLFIVLGPIAMMFVSPTGWIGFIIAIVGVPVLLVGMFVPFGKK